MLVEPSEGLGLCNDTKDGASVCSVAATSLSDTSCDDMFLESSAGKSIDWTLAMLCSAETGAAQPCALLWLAA